MAVYNDYQIIILMDWIIADGINLLSNFLNFLNKGYLFLWLSTIIGSHVPTITYL